MRPEGPIAALRRFAAEAQVAIERCDRCAAPLGRSHLHRFEAIARHLQCVCEDCDGDGDGWKLVRRRVVALPEVGSGCDALADLGLPLRFGFFSVSGRDGAATAYFPSPAGATASSVDAEDWAALCAKVPDAAAMRADIEALLIHRVNGARDAFIVSIDVCYHLVGALRAHWRGVTGDMGAPIEALMGSLRREAGRG